MIAAHQYILVDFENVQPKALDVFDKDHHRIIIFVGASQKNLSYEVASSIQRLGSRAEYVKISGNGPNALDFHIAFYIGRVSATEPGASFHIISKDKGFDPLLQHLKSLKIAVTRAKQVPLPVVPTVSKVDGSNDPAGRFEIIVAKLKKLGSSKPRKVKTLSSSIESHFQKKITADEVQSLVNDLHEAGLIVIDKTNVSYTL